MTGLESLAPLGGRLPLLRVDGTWYYVVAPIGKGGFGSVFLARPLLSRHAGDELVAIKVIDFVAHPDQQALERARDEARVLQLLDHDHIVRARGWEQRGAHVLLVMAYAPGWDLKKLMQHARIMHPAAVVDLGLQLSSALAAMHGHLHRASQRPLRIVHRDIKPANVRVGTDGVARLVDLGTVHMDDELRDSRTQAVVGSVNYMAPERFVYESVPAGDVFSLGLVMAECACGGRSAWRALRGSGPVEQRTAEVAEVLPVGARPLARLLCEMCSVAPDERPDAVSVHYRLREVQKEISGPDLAAWLERVAPDDESVVPPVGRWQRAALPAAALGIALLVGGGLWHLWRHSAWQASEPYEAVPEVSSAFELPPPAPPLVEEPRAVERITGAPSARTARGAGLPAPPPARALAVNEPPEAERPGATGSHLLMEDMQNGRTVWINVCTGCPSDQPVDVYVRSPGSKFRGPLRVVARGGKTDVTFTVPPGVDVVEAYVTPVGPVGLPAGLRADLVAATAEHPARIKVH